MTGGENGERLELDVSTTDALHLAPESGGGTTVWWVLGVGVALVAATVVALRVGESSAPPPPTTVTVSTMATPETAATTAPSSSTVADLEVGDVVKTDVTLPTIGLDVALLDDSFRLWVLHPGDGTATYRGPVGLHQISEVSNSSGPWVLPSLSVSPGGWLLVGGAFGTVTVNPEGQQILTTHAGTAEVSWDVTDSETYVYRPDTGIVLNAYGSGFSWFPAIRVGPMDRRVIVPTDEGSFLIDERDVSLLTPERVMDANQRFFVERNGDGQLTVAELESGTPVGTVSPSFLTGSRAAAVMADPKLAVSLAPGGRTVSLLDNEHTFIVDVSSGAGGQVLLDDQRDPDEDVTAAWDPTGSVVTWVVGDHIKIVGLDRTSATIGPTIKTDGPIAIGTPIAAVAYQTEPTG